MMNVGNPDEAFALSFIPNDGRRSRPRGASSSPRSSKLHPAGVAELPRSLPDDDVRRKLDELTHGYPNKPDFFVEKLAQGAAMIAGAFYPKPVILRLSDFKTNEYANLIGGKPTSRRRRIR
jgi:pyruvate,water dikinase